MITVDYSRELGKYLVRGPYDTLEICRSIPVRRWSKELAAWVVPDIATNRKFLNSLQAKATEIAEVMLINNDSSVLPCRAPPVGFTPKLKPFIHQADVLPRALAQDAFAYFMEPGTGKTKSVIDDATCLFMDGAIQAVFILCPNSIKSNWEDELAIHSSIPYVVFVYDADHKRAAEKFALEKGRDIRYFIMGIESLSQGGAYEVAKHVLHWNRAMAVVDESSRIKNHDSIRTRNAINLGKLATKRRVCSGTPFTKGLHHTWAQYEFLDPMIIDQGYFAFRNHFCVMGGFKLKQVVGTRNKDEFLELVRANTYTALKKNCLDLPPKTYQIRTVDMTPEQTRLTKGITAGFVRVDDKHILTYEYVITRELRLQQVTSGLVYKEKDPISGVGGEVKVLERLEKGITDVLPNPKLDELLAITEDYDGKIIVWCRFLLEIQTVVDALAKRYGQDSVVKFQGHGMNDDERTAARRTFQSNPDVRYFVGQISAGGIGLTLTAASMAVYMSNTFNLEDRIQSEDRIHRSGQEAESVTYIDLVCKGGTDERILKALRAGRNYIDYMMEQLSNG